MGLSILAGKDRKRLDNGMDLRLLSALEVLQARREAETLAQGERERALCSNACLLARALTAQNKPVFESGQAVLGALTVHEIAALSRQWREFDRSENPALEISAGELEDIKKN